jgi:hypothetical protein
MTHVDIGSAKTWVSDTSVSGMVDNVQLVEDGFRSMNKEWVDESKPPAENRGSDDRRDSDGRGDSGSNVSSSTAGKKGTNDRNISEGGMSSIDADAFSEDELGVTICILPDKTSTDNKEQ